MASQPDASSNEVPPREGVAGTDAGEAAALTTIVVTAQRRTENLQDVALAVSAFDGDALRSVGVTDAVELQSVVPSLTYVTGGLATQPYLRGIGTRSGWIGMESSVATYIDDRYVARPWAAMFQMLDIERVEVLKGPQGMLYGRNAAAGAIRAITKEPGSDRSVEIAGKVAENNHAVVNVLAGGPLRDELRGQLTARIEKRDGFATNLVPSGRTEADDLDREAFRAKLIWDIGDRAKAELGASWWRYTDWPGRDSMAAGVPQANRGATLYGGITSWDPDHFASAISSDEDDMREAAADLRFEVELGRVDFVSITTHTDDDFVQTFDTDISSVVLLDNYATERSAASSQEFQLLSTGDSGLEWMAGAFYHREDGHNVFVFRDSVLAQPMFPAGTDVTTGLQSVDTEAYALYGQAAYAFADQWSLTLGGRWNRESKHATLTPLPDAFTSAPAPFADASDWDEITPRASIEYRSRFGLAYLSYSRGFKSGGYNYPASTGPVLDPEILDSYEIGVKSDLLDERLRLNSAAFYSDVKGLQVTRGAAGALTTENAADAEVRGVEIDFDFALSDELSVNGGMAFIDSEYTEYVAGALVPLYVSPFGSAPLEGGFDVRGRSMLKSPDAALYVGVQYRKRLARGGSLPVSVNYAYKGDYYFDFSAVPETEWLKQSAYGVLNGRIAYVASDNRWEIGFSALNLTDEVYYEDAVLTTVSSRVSYADPRTYGIDFTLRL